MFSKINQTFSTISKVVMIVVVLVIGIVVWQKFGPKDRYYVDTSQAAVIQQIQELSKLETSSFTIEKIIEAGTQGNVFENILFGDRLLLIAHGKVIAGVDLSKLSKDQVTVSNNTVKIQLPKPEIFVVDLDQEKTRVYDRDKGLLTKGEKDLESEARKAAETSIRQAACEAGILDQANESAQKQLTSFLSAFNFETIQIEIQESGECE